MHYYEHAPLLHTAAAMFKLLPGEETFASLPSKQLRVYVFSITPWNESEYKQKQAVGGRPPRYAPAQACNGSAQQQPTARPAELGPISQYAPCTRPAAHAARRPDERARHQTDRRQTASSLNAPGRGHKKTIRNRNR